MDNILHVQNIMIPVKLYGFLRIPVTFYGFFEDTGRTKILKCLKKLLYEFLPNGSSAVHMLHMELKWLWNEQVPAGVKCEVTMEHSVDQDHKPTL